jgi:hypothetical protein
MSGDNNSDLSGQVEKGSGWTISFELLGVIIVLGGIAYWFLTGQSIDISGTTPNPTASKDPVDLSIDGYTLTIPANYLPLGRNRAGGDQEDVKLQALLPDMRGWSQQDSGMFASNAPDARVVQIAFGLTKDRNSEKQRFEKVLRPQLANAEGEPGPYGLTKYAFAEGQGSDGVEIYTFTAGENALIVLQCEKAGDPDSGPSCWRTIKPAEKDTVALTYRFKKSLLAEWPAIDQGVVRLLKQFRGEVKAPA